MHFATFLMNYFLCANSDQPRLMNEVFNLWIWEKLSNNYHSSTCNLQENSRFDAFKCIHTLCSKKKCVFCATSCDLRLRFFHISNSGFSRVQQLLCFFHAYRLTPFLHNSTILITATKLLLLYGNSILITSSELCIIFFLRLIFTSSVKSRQWKSKKCWNICSIQ